MQALAVFSACRRYRYLLQRTWNPLAATLTIIGLNPSRADASYTDPTIRRCLQFAQDWGYGSLIVANLFAYRSPYPEALRAFRRPIGPENDWYIQRAIHLSEKTLIAWGNDGTWRQRDRKVLKFIDQPWCLQINKSGQPAHPLYQPAHRKPIPYPFTY